IAAANSPHAAHRRESPAEDTVQRFSVTFGFLSLVVSVGSLGLALPPAKAQAPADWISSLPRPHDYVQKRVSSYDRTGGNNDFRPLPPGDTLTLLDEAGPGEISHIWFTIADPERFHLKKLVLRMYWDGEQTPSVEAPVGDFFGLGLGTDFLYQSLALSVGSDHALNCFLPMPFQKHARITATNEGSRAVEAFYWNIDLRAYRSPLPGDT